MNAQVRLVETPEADRLQCPRCHAPFRDRTLQPHQFLRCGRCGEELKSSCEGHGIQKAWAFATAGLLTLIPANTYPILLFSIAGNTQENLIITGVQGLWGHGYTPLGALVFFSAIAAPFLYLAGIWLVAACFCLRLRPPGLAQILHLTESLESWNLMPVFAIACIVSVVKLRTLGDVSWELGAAWVLLSAAITLFVVQFFDRKRAELFLEGSE
jgi:uncharacterized paraquat-inducible protein A